MPNYDTYKIYFTKNLSKNQEKKFIKKGGKVSNLPPYILSLLVRKVSNS